MDILNNRELSILIWLLILAAYLSMSSRRKKIAEALIEVFRAFCHPKILCFVSIMLGYCVVIVAFLKQHGLWNISHLKDALIWFCSVAFTSMFKFSDIKKLKMELQALVLNCLKLTAVIEFITSAHSLPLVGELILVPTCTLMTGIAVYSKGEDEYLQLSKIIETTLALIGTALVFNSIYEIVKVVDYSSLTSLAYDFSLPALLTFMFIPFLCVSVAYHVYERVYFGISFAIPSTKIRRVAIFCALVAFNLRIGLLERWKKRVCYAEISSVHEVLKSILQIFSMKKAEKSYYEVSIGKGWCPYSAKDFLNEEEIFTGYYEPSGARWYANSPSKNTGIVDAPIFLNYYVEGNQHVAETLKISLSIDKSVLSESAIQKFKICSEVLFEKSLRQPFPAEVELAINTRNRIAGLYQGCCVSFHAEDYIESMGYFFVITVDAEGVYYLPCRSKDSY